MTYSKNNSIATTDFASLAGQTGVAAPNSAAASAKAGYLWGVGFGDRGYGQSTPSLGVQTVGGSVGQEWQNLRTVMASLASWQGTNASTLPPSSAFNSSLAITAYPAGNPTYDVVTLLSALDANRANYQIGNMTLVAGATTTRSFAWGNSTNNISITAAYSMSFPNEDAVRFFFNTGGEIRFALSHPSSATPQDVSWSNALSNVVVAFRGNTSYKISGNTGSATGIGYYQLNGGWQTIYNGVNSGSGVYAANDYYIEAYTSGVAGVNGGNGVTLNFRVTFTDEFTGTVDNVSAGTTVNVSYLKAASLSLTLPTISTSSTLDGTYVPPPPSMTITIASNVQDFNLFNNRLASQYGGAVIVNGTYAAGTTINVIINSGVVVGASSTANYAFDTGTGWNGSDIINLTNSGYIVGCGGAGNSGNGGPAFRAQRAIKITNNGTVGGGGGGGGYGQGVYEVEGTNYYAGSGGGGGGAGYSGGAGGGSPNGTISTGYVYRYPGTGGGGTTTAGGAGGLGGYGSNGPNDYIVGGSGGTGGSLGGAGGSGGAGSTAAEAGPPPAVQQWYPATDGGAGGACTSGNVNITWATAGARYGTLA